MLRGTCWDSLFFTRGYPVILHPWLKTLLFPHWIILTLWKKSTDHINEDLFLDFLSVLNLYFPFYFLALFFLNIILASLGPFHFCVDFIIILSILILKSLLRLYWISTVTLERTDILPILSLPINNMVSLPIYWNIFFWQDWVTIYLTETKLFSLKQLESPILWPPDEKSWLTRKDLDAGKNWGEEEKGVIEDEMVRWYHWLNGHELSKLWEIVKDWEAWCAAVHGLPRVGYLATEQQQQLRHNWCIKNTLHMFNVAIWWVWTYVYTHDTTLDSF